jgi:hypothetical protein
MEGSSELKTVHKWWHVWGIDIRFDEFSGAPGDIPSRFFRR